MPHITITREVVEDLFAGRATYIQKKQLRFTEMQFSNESLLFRYKKKIVAELKFPEGMKFDKGDTVTVQLQSSMKIYFDNAF